MESYSTFDDHANTSGVNITLSKLTNCPFVGVAIDIKQLVTECI